MKTLHKRLSLGVLAGVAVAALSLGGTQTAFADPAPGTNPVLDGFGSDTTQDVLNGLAATITDEHGNALIASYNAGRGLIDPGPGEDPGSPTVPRANGSGQGKTALLAAINGAELTLNGISSSGPLDRADVEFARSSSAAKWVAGGKLNYLPFGIDGLSAAVPTPLVGSVLLDAVAETGKPLELGTASDPTDKLTLRNIYLGTVPAVSVDGELLTLTPLLPQSGSGSRAFWLQALGLTEAQVKANENVHDIDRDGESVQENDGRHLKRDTDLMPFSAASFISQRNASAINQAYGLEMQDRRGGARLTAINGQEPVTASHTLNLEFPVLRPVFNVVERAAITPGAGLNPALAGVFNGSDAKILTAKSKITAGGTVIADFGFGVIPAGGWLDPVSKNTFLPGDENYLAN